MARTSEQRVQWAHFGRYSPDYRLEFGVMASPRNPETPPTSLDRSARELWRLTLAQLKDQGGWSPCDAPLLARYVVSLEVARLARRRIAAAVGLTWIIGALIRLRFWAG
jgi:phage terminase small subunit